MSDVIYAISTNEENYEGSFSSIEEALAEMGPDDTHAWIGVQVKPTPETYFDADKFLDRVSESEEFSFDFAEDWDRSTKEQRAELEVEVQGVIAEWLDRHNLRPNFWLVEDVVKYERGSDGKFEPVPKMVRLG